MGNKQTAVEWLLENLKESLSIEQATAIINKAKEMERQQIMDAVNATIIDDDLNAYEYFTEEYE
jgi:tRNA uridine 5-carbamoylmethylation protein Kti12